MTRALASRPLLLVGLMAALLGAAFLALPARSADAHPLGNFTINRYSRIELYRDLVRVHYELDIAEIPAFQEMDRIDTDASGDVSPAEADAYAARLAGEIAADLDLRLDGENVALEPAAAAAAFPEGQGGLDTIRLSAVFEAGAAEGLTALEYTDANYDGRLGWKEIVVPAVPGLVIEGDAPSSDVSAALTSYPDGLLSSPLDVTSVAFSFDSSNAAPAPALTLAEIKAAPASRAGGGFTSLIDAENLTLTVVLLALVAAFGFGALHALEPGHGKTLVAAYFVGVRGSLRQALLLGLIVASTHTIGVLSIGLVAIFASKWVLPEDLYPWLSLASGLMVLALGVRLFAQRGGGRLLHRLTHLLPFAHHHHDHEAPRAADGPPPWRTLIALGLADGLTPSPSALVVLLAAVSLGRVGLGVGLILAFSVGLAAVLAGVSVALLYARRVTDSLGDRMTAARSRLPAFVSTGLSAEGALVRMMPIGGALVLIGVGLALTVRALGSPALSI